MKKKHLLFPLFLLTLTLFHCGARLAPVPYYDGMRHQVSFNEEILQKMKDEIKKFYGAPYRWGGDSSQGTDCSGLIVTIYKNSANITLPHNTQEIFARSKKIYKMDLLFGDLVFFSSHGRQPTHMGLYLTKGYFVHASSTKGVILSKLSDRYYASQFIGARRIEIY
ncbi:C40 family peptidase [candidate division KSB1 bacterium]|nr:C40 family peptidase [candidate division KSB1 bacterium]